MTTTQLPIKLELTQGAVKTLLKSEGLDVTVMPCCVVNQSSLAIDARDPVQLVATIERLIGTWPMRMQLQELDKGIADKAIQEESAVAHVAELSALRLRLRPEVSKLLDCKQQYTDLERTNKQTLTLLAKRLQSTQATLHTEVCTVCDVSLMLAAAVMCFRHHTTSRRLAPGCALTAVRHMAQLV